MRVFTGIIALFCCSMVAKADLMTGDIAIIGLSGDSTDEFSWVPLVDIAAGEEIYFTDVGYYTASSDYHELPGATDTVLRYKAPADGVTAGTVQTVIDRSEGLDYTFVLPAEWGKNTANSVPTSISFASSGDQIYAFQTDLLPNDSNFGVSDITGLFAVNGATTDWTSYTGSNNANASNLYLGLTDGQNAVAAGDGAGSGDEYNNIRYEGILTGTQAELLAAIADVNNWTGTDTTPGSGYTDISNGVGFTIQGDTAAVPEPSTWALLTLAGVGFGGHQLRRRKVTV